MRLDRRRVAVGEKIELPATAHDAKGAPIPDVKYEARVECEKADSRSRRPSACTTRGMRARARSYAVEKFGQPANDTVTVIGKKDGQEIGRDFDVAVGRPMALPEMSIARCARPMCSRLQGRLPAAVGWRVRCADRFRPGPSPLRSVQPPALALPTDSGRSGDAGRVRIGWGPGGGASRRGRAAALRTPRFGRRRFVAGRSAIGCARF